jgi:two-component system cell cycle sensor histidine kinase/response regulator CckA
MTQNQTIASWPVVPAEATLARLMQYWPGVFFRQSADFTFDYVSPKIEELTGLPAASWRKSPAQFWQVVHELDADELRQQIKNAAQSAESIRTVYRIRHTQAGRVAYISEIRQALRDEAGRVFGYEGLWLDVTPQTIAERRLSAAAWKETLAVLTMGLAHDFSNVMAGILSLSESFISQIGSDHPFHQGLSLIKQNAWQASQLVHRIVNLHHGKIGNRTYHDLNEITTDAVELMRKVIPRRIDVRCELAPMSLPLFADAVDFRQVIVNLALNAADAMSDSGTLRFRTSLHAELPKLTHHQGVFPRLPAVCLAVEDNGCGIKAAHLRSIFDPFFTTKAMNKGSGLGLYNARLFVEKHHGAISVDSVEGRGTTFCIWLPQADFTEADQEEKSDQLKRRSLLLLGPPGKGRDSTAEFLRLNGYHVVAADAQPGALDLLHAPEYQFEGILVQVEANDLDSLSLAANVRKQKLPVKTILQIVGCNQDEFETQFLLNVDLILSSDMSQEAILEKLRSLFAGTSSSLP